MEKKFRPVVDLSAACACGGASLRLTGKVLSMFLCSCEDCQRATGTGHAAILLARRADVAVAGTVNSFARPSHSGATLTRHFCPGCGTPLFAQSNRAAEIVMLPVGLFGGAAAEWYVPNQLIFARSHRDWDVVAADLSRYDTYRDQGGPM